MLRAYKHTVITFMDMAGCIMCPPACFLYSGPLLCGRIRGGRITGVTAGEG